MPLPKVEEFVKGTEKQIATDLLNEEKPPEEVAEELTGEELIGKVEDATQLPVLLGACAESPEAVSPEGYAQLEHHFAKALNSGKCPCESGKNFADCCKPMWMMARRAWKNRGDSEADARKEEHKREMDEAERAAKMEKEVRWIVRVGLDKNGQAVVGPMGEPGEKFRIGLAKRILLEAWETLSEQLTAMQVEATLGALIQRAQQGNPIGKKFSM